MAVKAGQVVYSGGNRYIAKSVLDRAQSINAALSIPSEKVFEIGNAQTVADVRDTPELSVDVESWDVAPEYEALLLGLNPTTLTAGQQLDLLNAKPIDIVSAYKKSLTDFNVEAGVAWPYLTLESAAYRFGVGQNSAQTFTVRGDAVYYIPGVPYFEAFPAAGVGPYLFTNGPSIVTVEQGDNLFAYSVTLCLADGTYTRLFLGDDYTNDANGFTLTTAAPVGSFLHVVYGSLDPDSYPQSVHQGVSVKPAAVRGAHVDVFVSDGAATPTMIRWKGVQTAEVNWRLTLEATKEMGNVHDVSRDYNAPDLSGTLTVRPRDVDYLFGLISQITGVPTTETINALSSVALDMQIRISHPTTGVVLKTLVVDEARFTPPSPALQANQYLDMPFTFSSDTGSLKVVNGLPL